MRTRITLTAGLIFCLCHIIPAGYAQANKSGLEPSVLSLPSGPGSIEGLGESFEPQLNSGTGAYRIPLAVPPGRAGFMPQLALAYNAGNGNGVFGQGWRLEFPSIKRQTDKGQPFYTDYPTGDGVDNDKDGEIDEYDEFDTLIFSDGEELVPTQDGYWRFENESRFIRFQRQTEGWAAQRKDGTTLRFGSSSESRVQNEDGRIFQWYLDEMTDPNGNRILFHYDQKDDGPRRYCTRIEYNISASSRMAIVFAYEPRPDILIGYQAGFQLKTAYRCSSVQMMEGDQPVRTYRFSYEAVNDTEPVSRLSSIVQIGRDGVSELPPAEFTYTSFEGSTAQAEVITDSPNADLDDPNIDLTDLNADSLPDILDTNTSPHTYYLNLGPDQNGAIQWSEKRTMATDIQIYLGADNVRLADMDGDAKADILNLSGTDVHYYGVGADLSWQSRDVVSGAGFLFSDPNVQMMDMNNDKRIDVIQTTGFSHYVWINLKTGKWSQRYTEPSSDYQLQFNRATTRVADMNGDRIQDLIYLENGTCYYHPGIGYGRFGEKIRMKNPPYPMMDISRAFTSDVNGDGLADVVYVGNDVRVWLNLGLDQMDHTRGEFAPAFSVSTPLLNAFTVFRNADINGNGSVDLIWNVDDGTSAKLAYLDFAPGEQPYQLKTITNGIGRTTTISYRSHTVDMVRDRESGHPWPETLPFPISVVAEIEVDDGIQSHITEFEYHNGYYNSDEKEFRGFSGAEKRAVGDVSAPDLITAFTYDIGVLNDALKGKPLSVEARDAAGAVFFRDDYNWETKEVATPVDSEIRQITLPYQSMKNREILEKGNGTPVSLKWEYVVDDYGNLTRLTEHGRLDPGWDDERITEAVYSSAYPAGRSKWILNRLISRTVTDENGDRVSHKRQFYDGSTILGELTRGNPTRIEDWVADNHYVVSVRNDYDSYGNIVAIYDPLYGTAPGHYREIRYDDTYHTFPVQETIHTGNAEVPSLSMVAEYDHGFGVMTAATDFNGQTTRFEYDTFGRPAAVTKPPDTGHTLEYEYVLAHTLPDGGFINWVETRQRDHSPGDGFLHTRSFYDGLGRKIMTRSEDEEPGRVVVSDTVQFNARNLPARNYLPYFETGTLDFADPTFTSGFTEHFYDALGRVIRTNQPEGPEGIAHSEVEYEPFVKTIRDEEQTDPTSPHYGCGMRYVQDGLLDKDGNGRLREAHEIVKLSDLGEPLDSPVTWVTRYRYDLMRNLTGYTDSQLNQKIIEYDGLGRKTFMNDPDRGYMYYWYDDASNLIRTRDAKGQIIKYEYDGANRLVSEYYGENKTDADVAYHYDSPFGPVDRGYLWNSGEAESIADTLLNESAYQESMDLNEDGIVDVADVVSAEKEAVRDRMVTAENTKGRLSWVKDQSGEEHNSYDERGRVIWTVKRIIDTGPNDLRNFYTGKEYDPMDRIKTITYPDLTKINYFYNSRGLVDNIPNVLAYQDYNEAGQKKESSLACGVVTKHKYDHRLRLSRLYTLRSGDQLPLQDLNYIYDNVSNVLNITDSLSTRSIDTIAKEMGINNEDVLSYNSTQEFKYDSLYRLIKASSSDGYGTIKYQYDPIGNMIRKDDSLTKNLEYGGVFGATGRIGRDPGDPAGPHALSKINITNNNDTEIVEYDQNGNMIKNNNINLSWDYKNRLSEVIVPNIKSFEYGHDYSNIRIIEIYNNPIDSSTNKNFYVNKLFELREGDIVKYVYSNGERLAFSKKTTGSDFISTHFYIKDHLGSTNYVVSNNAELMRIESYYPYGSIRKEKTVTQLTDVPHHLSGKEFNRETGLHYFDQRYYYSSFAKFVTIDPLYLNLDSLEKDKFSIVIRNPYKLNLYSYARNNPVSYLDAFGLEEYPVIIKAFQISAELSVEVGIMEVYDIQNNTVHTYFIVNVGVETPTEAGGGISVQTGVITTNDDPGSLDDGFSISLSGSVTYPGAGGVAGQISAGLGSSELYDSVKKHIDSYIAKLADNIGVKENEFLAEVYRVLSKEIYLNFPILAAPSTLGLSILLYDVSSYSATGGGFVGISAGAAAGGGIGRAYHIGSADINPVESNVSNSEKTEQQ